MSGERERNQIEGWINYPKSSNTDETQESLPLNQRREITVEVESIENIDPSKVKEILVKIEFAGSILAESEVINVDKSNVDVGLIASITTEEVTPTFLEEILAHPLLLIDCTPSVSEAISQPSPVLKLEKTNKNKSSKTAKTSPAPSTALKSNTFSPKILGICNVDIGGLVMGKKKIKETLLLELEKEVPPQEMITWVKFPRLVISVSTGDELLVPESMDYLNVMGITVESVYNIPKNIGEGSVWEASIPIPSMGDKMNNLVFPNGVVTYPKGSDFRKKWYTLPHIEGNGGKSKYVIEHEVCDITNTLPKCLNLEKEMNKYRKKIQWNTWKNSLILKSDCNFLYSKLMKYRVWPIEIYPSSKPNLEKGKSENKSKAEKKSQSSATLENSEHFIAFLNVSTLLYPGVTKARVATQLYTYSQKDLVDKFGAKFTVSSSQSFAMTKGASERSKVSEIEENQDGSGVPVFNENGSPTFIVVEVEFYKPFIPKKDPVFLEEQLNNCLSLKGKIDKKTMNLPLALENFETAIKDIVSVIIREHQNFMIYRKEGKSKFENIDKDFDEFISCQESFLKMKSTLENKAVVLINEKFGNLSHYKERMPQFYIYLVEEMHKITNTSAIGQHYVSLSHFNANELQLYVEEAFEQEEYDLSKNYLLLKLSRNPGNPDYWLDYGVFSIHINDCETALEAIREALSLNPTHQLGLLLYGLLMMKMDNPDIAELAFQVLLNKYPDFIEGWMVLNLFYLSVENYEGEDVSFLMAKRLELQRRLQEKENEDGFRSRTFPLKKGCNVTGDGKYGIASFKNGKSLTDSLVWTISFCPPDNLKIKTAILLLKLGFYEFSMVALSNEIISEEANSPHCLYYFAVCHYLQGHYEETLSYLDTFVKHFGKDCFLWELMGHCCYKLENISNAVACYEYVMESFNRRDDIHLIYLRMGYYYLEAKKYSCAKQVFLTACNYSPSPKLWKGCGIACLRMRELDQAELAFTEANYLDNTDGETWAYLALTNALLGRLKLCQYCYEEAYKKNLRNENLIQEIEFCIASNQMGFIDDD